MRGPRLDFSEAYTYQSSGPGTTVSRVRHLILKGQSVGVRLPTKDDEGIELMLRNSVLEPLEWAAPRDHPAERANVLGCHDVDDIWRWGREGMS